VCILRCLLREQSLRVFGLILRGIEQLIKLVLQGMILDHGKVIVILQLLLGLAHYVLVVEEVFG
jgi:hypothetical protein